MVHFYIWYIDFVPVGKAGNKTILDLDPMTSTASSTEYVLSQTHLGFKFFHSGKSLVFSVLASTFVLPEMGKIPAVFLWKLTLDDFVNFILFAVGVDDQLCKAILHLNWSQWHLEVTITPGI